MILKNEIKISLDGFEKCYMHVEQDCPLGQLYDFSCALRNFAVQKMQEAESAQQKPEEKPEEKSDVQSAV